VVLNQVNEMTNDVPELLIVGPVRKNFGTLVLAHGAGAPMDSDFMNIISAGLAELQFRVIRFEFPYMSQRRISGKSKPPNRGSVLNETWLKVITSIGADRLIIGGKSMGGRIASMVADQAGVAGVVCLGYPFHPTGKPDNLRIDHLQKIKTPVLVVQGERDPFGNKNEVPSYSLGRKVKIHWLADGDHSFKPRKKSGVSLEQNMESAVNVISQFVRNQLK